MLLLFLAIIITPVHPYTKELESIHVIFRHGDRTPVKTYPNDPYANYTYPPYGYGQLTKAGKITAYNLGVSLRRAYAQFLGNTYSPSIVKAISTDYERCKMSTQLVLAGLFPPQNYLEMWNKNLSWQPIPYDSLPKATDKILRPTVACPKFAKWTADYRKSANYSAAFSKYPKISDYIKRNSGYHSLYLNDATTVLYATLKAQEEWGLKLPSWTKKVWPETIKKLAAISWKQTYGSNELKSLGAGFLILQILEEIKLISRQDRSVSGRKIYLYGCHDWNIVAILSFLGVLKPHVPAYGAYIKFEIYKIKQERFINIYYQNYDQLQPTQIQIPQCAECCSVSQFTNLYSKYLNPDMYCA